jgi:23S rRNA (adenine2503-C2)-methyltransferase
MKTRHELFTEAFPHEKKFRLKQIDQSLFDTSNTSWQGVTTLSKILREGLASTVPFWACRFKTLNHSEDKTTYKAIVLGRDELEWETVLMRNKKGSWTICVSSQVGCAMGCVFCATGKMGLKRNLNADEIVDQYRLWTHFLKKYHESERISNIVFMGMGEPLANYEHVKNALNTILKHTDLGPTKITVSSVGVLATLDQILDDPQWPNTRLTISLHSPDPVRRNEIVPSTFPKFHEKLADWTHRYIETLGNRNHHITFAYTLIDKINDTAKDAHALAKYTKKTGATKINVIPYNPIFGSNLRTSQQERIDAFKEIIRLYGLDITQRKTMGDDIDAACGQLVRGDIL